MKEFLKIPFFCLVLFLVGCDERTPPNSLTRDVVLKAASGELLDGMEITDFEHDNGWVDQGAQNRYIVQYKYNIKLTKSFPIMVLGLAKSYSQQVEEARAKPFAQAFVEFSLGTNAMQIRNHEDYSRRREKLLSSCQECMEFLAAGGSKELVSGRSKAFDAAWNHLLTDFNFGLKDEHTVGSKLSRTYWVPFMKTEKGWARQGS